jgi:hypothetical protein
MMGKAVPYLVVSDQHRLGGKIQGYVPLGILLDELLNFFLGEFTRPFRLECDHKVGRCEPRTHRHYRCDIMDLSAPKRSAQKTTLESHEAHHEDGRKRARGPREECAWNRETSPKSTPKPPLDLLIPSSYHFLPKGNKHSTCNGNTNTNCVTLVITNPRINRKPNPTPFANCAQVLLGRSDIGRAYRAAGSDRGGGVGEGLSTMTVIRWILDSVEW